VKVVILAGGLGTRLSEETAFKPKPMVEIGERPILWHIMKGYSHHGIDDFVLCLGYKGWVIKEFFLNYHAMTSDLTVHLGQDRAPEHGGRPVAEKWNVALAETGEATQTGGRVTAVRPYLEGNEPFCLTYGDGVADVDIGELVRFHKQHGKIATVTAVRPPSRFGEMRMTADVVSEFNEKPQVAEGFINGGFFVFDAARIWAYLGTDPMTLLEREPLQRLTADGELVAFRHTGFWQPMDTLREYHLLNDLWNSGKAPWRSWT
jgi:glucose-1-phosphate cytidylyltransferase